MSLLSHTATFAHRLRINVHDNDNDNAWQRGPLRPHRMGPIISHMENCMFSVQHRHFLTSFANRIMFIFYSELQVCRDFTESVFVIYRLINYQYMHVEPHTLWWAFWNSVIGCLSCEKQRERKSRQRSSSCTSKIACYKSFTVVCCIALLLLMWLLLWFAVISNSHFLYFALVFC